MSEWTPEITIFTCQYCGHVPAEMAGAERRGYPASAKIETVPCAGRVDLLHMLRALEQGADGVLVLACPDGNCHHLSGNERASLRVTYARELLAETGMETDRLRFAQLGIGQGATFAALVSELTETIRSLGPSPMRQPASPRKDR